MALTECPTCHGDGLVYGIGSPGFKPVTLICDICLGEGEVDKKNVLRGEKMRKERLGRGLSLRKESKRLNIDAWIISARERGKCLEEDQESLYQQAWEEASNALEG